MVSQKMQIGYGNSKEVDRGKFESAKL